MNVKSVLMVNLLQNLVFLKYQCHHLMCRGTYLEFRKNYGLLQPGFLVSVTRQPVEVLLHIIQTCSLGLEFRYIFNSANGIPKYLWRMCISKDTCYGVLSDSDDCINLDMQWIKAQATAGWSSAWGNGLQGPSNPNDLWSTLLTPNIWGQDPVD